MKSINVDNQVFERLNNISSLLRISCNELLRIMLKIERVSIEEPKPISEDTPEKEENNIQEKLVPVILKILYYREGRAPKKVIEDLIFNQFRNKFRSEYFQESVSHGVPRWKHSIAWAKERAKTKYGFIKSAKDSGIGIWELTEKGMLYCKKQFAQNSSSIKVI